MGGDTAKNFKEMMNEKIFFWLSNKITGRKISTPNNLLQLLTIGVICGNCHYQKADKHLQPKKTNVLLLTDHQHPLSILVLYLHDCSKKVTDFCPHWGGLYIEKPNLGPPFISKGGSGLILAPLRLRHEETIHDGPEEP